MGFHVDHVEGYTLKKDGFDERFYLRPQKVVSKQNSGPSDQMDYLGRLLRPWLPPKAATALPKAATD